MFIVEVQYKQASPILKVGSGVSAMNGQKSRVVSAMPKVGASLEIMRKDER